MKTKKKNQKPTDYDIHLKYVCKKCGNTHWLSFKETSTKNFKIVCDCGKVFGVKRTKQFQIKYCGNPKPKEKPKISNDLLNRSIKAFIGYGFTKDEASELLIKSYESNPIEDLFGLVKQTLEYLRSENVSKRDASINAE